MCSACHNYLGSNPNDYRDWKLQQLGEARYKALVLRGHATRKDKLDWKLEAAKWRKALRDQGIDI